MEIGDELGPGCCPPALVSIDNGQHLVGAADLTDKQLVEHEEALVHSMDDATRERVHGELAPCEFREFLARYLEVAPANLVIG